MYVACSEVFRDVASVAMPANGFVGFDGAGIAIAMFALLVPWPGVGCDVTGPSSFKSSCEPNQAKSILVINYVPVVAAQWENDVPI